MVRSIRLIIHSPYLKLIAMKSVYLLLLFSLPGFAGFSQKVVLKPTLGINFTDFSKDPEEGKFTAQPGWQIGGSVAIGRKFFVEPGVFYMQKSTKFTTISTPVTESNYNISGIRIPVTIGYNLIGNVVGAFNIRVLGGGSVNIITSVNQGEKSDYTSPTWGVFAGAGVDFLFLFVDLKYEWSLTTVSSSVTNVNIGESRSFFINVGARIPLIK
jgi:Outer membrane protein beta-barrel domain